MFAVAEKYQFTNVDKTEYSRLYGFLKKKRIQIKNLARAEESLKHTNMPATATEISSRQLGGFANMDLDATDSDDSDFDENAEHSSSQGSDSDDTDSGSSNAEEAPRKRAKHDSSVAKKKAKRDPKYPKRPQSAYNFFVQKKSKSLKSENSTLSSTDLLKKVSELWKEVSDDERTELNELVQKDKARFEKELKAYTPSEGFDSNGKQL